MLRLGVCDDEEMGLRMVAEALEASCKKKAVAAQVERFSSPSALLTFLQKGAPLSALFLDICMPEIDGISLGTRLSRELEATPLIFVSGREDLVFQSFQARPFRFLRKNLFSQEFPAVFEALLGELEKKGVQKLSFPGEGGEVFLCPEDIFYLESFRKIQVAHTWKEEVQLHSSFEKLEEILSPYGFWRIHKSYLVNSHAIRSLHADFLILDDGTRLPLGRTKVAFVREAFRQMMLGETSL